MDRNAPEIIDAEPAQPGSFERPLGCRAAFRDLGVFAWVLTHHLYLRTVQGLTTRTTDLGRHNNRRQPGRPQSGGADN
jgi:hypothetical protein